MIPRYFTVPASVLAAIRACDCHVCTAHPLLRAWWVWGAAAKLRYMPGRVVVGGEA